MEAYISKNLPAKYFIGLAVDQKAPDHFTLTVFRKRLLRRGKLKVLEEMLTEIIQIAQQKGVQFGLIQIVDSVHREAFVNIAKNTQRQTKGKKPHDPNARWDVKHKRKVKDEAGK